MYNLANNTPVLPESTTQQLNKEYQTYFVFVIFLVSLQLICNTIEPIVLHIGIFTIPASALFYVLSFAISDVITENFGFKLAVRATVLNVIAQLFYCGIATIIFLLPKSFQAEEARASFQYIFHFLSLELLSSIVSLLIAMVVNDYAINRLKFLFLGKGFWWRTIVSTVIGEITMLNIDYNMTFYGQRTLVDIQHLIANAMLYKIAAAILLAYPMTLLSTYVSQRIYFLKPYMNQKTLLLTDLKNAILFK